MVDKIFQLRSHEYTKLVKLASLNEDNIQTLARKMYEEKGVHKLYISVGFDESNNEEIDVKPIIHINNWGSNYYPFSEEEETKVTNFFENAVKTIFIEKYGSNFLEIENLQKKKKAYDGLRKTFIVFTALGWLMAILILLILIQKSELNTLL